MRNQRLVDLNFREIVNYGGQPPVKVRYNPPLACHGYCVSCEQSGVLEQAGGELDLMSHGCDSKDYETVLGPMRSQGPHGARPITEPVLFLLNEPANAYWLGKPIPYLGFKKQPPVKHYYWTPGCQNWPGQVAELNDFYGPYFAYLMRRHQLQNVYITNQVKCRWHRRKNGRNKQLVVEHCVNRFLKREVEIFTPKLALCFGKLARQTFQEMRVGIPSCHLLHPGYIQFKWQTHPKARNLKHLRDNKRRVKVQEQLFQCNDDRIERRLQVLRNDDPEPRTQ